MTIKLSETQLVLMSAAAQREDRCLVASQHLKGGAAKKVAAKLISAGLVREVRAKADMPIWRRDEAGPNYALKLTAAGLNAIAVDEDVPTESDDAGAALPAAQTGDSTAAIDRSPAPASCSSAPNRSSMQPRDRTKLVAIVELLQRVGGATVDELISATGWLPHTMRAALTGLRKRNYIVSRTREDGARNSVYRIVAHDAEDAPRSVLSTPRKTLAALSEVPRDDSNRDRLSSNATLDRAA